MLLEGQEQLLLMRKDGLVIHTLKVLHRVRDRLVALRLHTLILPRLRILLLRLLCRLLMLGLIKTILLHHNFLSCMLYLLRWLHGYKLLFLLCSLRLLVGSGTRLDLSSFFSQTPVLVSTKITGIFTTVGTPSTATLLRIYNNITCKNYEHKMDLR